LKVDSDDVVHKSDAGGVVLNIIDEKTLMESFKKMKERFKKHGGSFVLMEQKAPGREIIIGSTASPGLGNLIMFGLGGVFVEVMKDVIVGVAPLSRPEAKEMMRGIRGYPILEGVRGERPADLGAVEDLLLRVSRLAADFPQITEMDLNPIFVYPEGEKPAAVDVRLKVK
jgi:acetyltransferase